MSISSIDHIALPLENVEDVLAFYRGLGFTLDTTNAPMLYSVHLKNQKINFHGPRLWHNSRFTLKGPQASPGCGDVCFVWNADVEALKRLLHELSIEIIEGPVSRDGGRNHGKESGTSIYVRDPDQNLIEFICYENRI